MPEQDDYATALGSMDRGQLQALLAQLNDRARMDPLNEAGGGVGAAPGVSGGAFQNPFQEDIASGGIQQASLYNQYKRFKNRKADKKARAEHERQVAAERERTRGILGERAKSVQNQIRTLDLRDKVKQQYQDMDLEGLFKRVSDAGLQNNMLGITQQFEDLGRQGGFGAAQTGLAGGSVDATRLADTDAAQQQSRAQAVAGAQQQFEGLKQQSKDQQDQVLQSISGANPGEEARLSGELSNVWNQTNQFANQANAGIQNQNTQAAGMAGQSQALGGLLSTYANLYTQNQMKRP